MSFFFNKSESEGNLQYDDTAFMHFAITGCIVTTILFSVIILKDYSASKLKGLKKLKKMPIFQSKILNTEKKSKSYLTTMAFCWKFIVIIFCVTFAILCFSEVEGSEKMIGFDPNQILGVEIDAPVNVIKKAYRKLALEFHPDRNHNNPAAAAKFIQISKAYQCLTDEQAKQKCAKYGNPDGQASFKVGIGLPKLMVQAGNQYLILIPIFVFLLVVIPQGFIRWSNKIKPKDNSGNLIVNYPICHSFFSPKFKIFTCPILIGCLKQLDAYFPERKTLPEDKQKGFKSILLRTDALTEEQLSKIQPHILYRCYMIYVFMSNQQKDDKIADKIADIFPDLCHKMVIFSCFYAQRMLNGQLLGGDPNMPITWCGLEPTRNILFFTLQMYNPSIRDVKSIQFLDLTPQQIEIARKKEVKNIHKQILDSEQKIDAFLKDFPEKNRSYIKEQLKCLPAFDVSTRVLLGDEEVESMSVDDFAVLEITLKKNRDTLGYIITKDHTRLTKQNFYLMLSYNSNLMFFTPFTNDNFNDENKLVFTIQHRQSVQRDMKFKVQIFVPYPKMNIETQLSLDVLAKRPQNQIIINKEDLELEKIPKNFFESLISLEAYNQSDRELSDGSDTEEQEEPLKKKKNKFEQQDDSPPQRCCDGHQGHHH